MASAKEKSKALMLGRAEIELASRRNRHSEAARALK